MEPISKNNCQRLLLDKKRPHFILVFTHTSELTWNTNKTLLMDVDWPNNDLPQEILLLQHTFKVLLSQNRKAHNFVTFGCLH